MKKLLAALFLFVSVLYAVNSTTVRAVSVTNVIRFTENFDGVSAPAIPAGWSVSSTGSGSAFATATTNSDTAPNSVFSPAPATTGSATLTSPPILVSGATTLLNFRHRYAMETTWDGGVLEISIAGGPFTDILAAGGMFVTGAYSHDLSPSSNPISGRRAWSGATQGGFQSVSVRLPANSVGQNVRFRWIIGTNDSFGADGWWIDTVTIESVPTGANTGSVTINSSGNANPYPSEIQIAGLTGFVTNVSVTLEDFTHPNPDDVDILLVAPNGRRVVLMSDTGGSNQASSIDLAFSDAASAGLPDSGALAAGIYRPTNFDDVDVFPPPAPQGGSNSAILGSLFGSVPNGTWQLFIVDDTGGNAGAVNGGWSLDIQTSVNACLFNLNPPAQGFSAAGGSGSFEVIIPAGCGWTASTSSSFVSLNTATSGIGSGSIGFTVQPNAVGPRTGLITISDGLSTKTFQAQQASGCPTSVAQSSTSFTAAGGTGSINVSASSGCTWNATSPSPWVSITSASQSGNGVATFIVAPNPTRNARSTTVTIGAQTVAVNQAGASGAAFDFDGDGRGDISIYRTGTWHLLQSNNGQAALQFGIANDGLVPADYDGDGKSDIAVFRGGTWYILRSSDSQVAIYNFGIAGDITVPADYDGDGRAEIAVFRSGIWYTQNLASAAVTIRSFGLAGDKPVPADYDGDGLADVAVFRSGIWYLQRSVQGFAAIAFGLAADRLVPADYDGDGRSDPAVFRNGIWHILANFQNYSAVNFGLAGDVPVPADYDGDGKTDPAVFRSGTWYLLRSTQGIAIGQFGLSSDIAVPGARIQ